MALIASGRMAPVVTPCWMAVIASATTLGCMETPTTPGEPDRLAAVGGRAQLGKAGEELAEQFRVIVTDAHGTPVWGVQVDWTVSEGKGLFPAWPSAPGDHARFHTSVTNHSGGTHGAAVRFMPTALGAATVTATARTSTRTIGSVEFSAHADGVVVHVGSEVSPEAAWPRGPQEVLVPLGTTVEWLNQAQRFAGSQWWWEWPTVGRLVSRSTPAGGAAFESKWLSEGERFAFTPDVRGEWEWEFSTGSELIVSATLVVQ